MRKKLTYVVKHMLPLVAIVLMTILMFGYIYQAILETEQENCWQTLEDTAGTINDLINARLTDNINTLRLVSNAMVQEERVESHDAIIQHINAFQPRTIFNRIDLLYEDGTMLLQTGETKKYEGTIELQQLQRDGLYISARMEDSVSGKQVISCCVPIISEDTIVGALIGIIECDTLPEYFGTRAYGGEAITCIVDAADGSFIMDDWHDKLGNMYEMKRRKLMPDYADVDFVADVRGNKTGAFSYISEKNQQISYMYYTPVGIGNWELLIQAQDAVAFSGVLAVKHYMTIFIIMEVLLICLYLLWGGYGTYQLLQGKEEVEKLSITDGLTHIYNRHRFNDAVKEYQSGQDMPLGIAYFDANGLKKTNDTQGHEAGDRMIISIAEAIREIFPQQTYRIGGDEFAVLAPISSEELFMEQLHQVENRFKEQQLSVSSGGYYCPSTKKVETGLAEADHRMYDCKQAYYRMYDRRQQIKSEE